MPPKEEVKTIREHLAKVTKSAAESHKEAKIPASKIYDNDQVVVTASVFENTKTTAPKGKSIPIKDITSVPSFD